MNVFRAGLYRTLTPDNSFHLPRSSRLDPNLQLNPLCPLGPQINVSKIQSNDHDQPPSLSSSSPVHYQNWQRTVNSNFLSNKPFVEPQGDHWLILDFERQSQWSLGSTLKLGIPRVNVLTAKKKCRRKNLLRNISNHRWSQWLKIKNTVNVSSVTPSARNSNRERQQPLTSEISPPQNLLWGKLRCFLDTLIFCKTSAAWLAKLGERRSAKQEVAGSNPGRNNSQGLNK